MSAARRRCGSSRSAKSSSSSPRRNRRVGKAERTRERAFVGVPTIHRDREMKMVGTAQGRLCPPYDAAQWTSLSPEQIEERIGLLLRLRLRTRLLLDLLLRRELLRRARRGLLRRRPLLRRRRRRRFRRIR